MAHLVITIGCEYGAKGNQIGKKVAKDLGIKFYDRDTVDEIIKEVGIPKDIMEKVEEGITIAGKGAEGDGRVIYDSKVFCKASSKAQDTNQCTDSHRISHNACTFCRQKDARMDQ